MASPRLVAATPSPPPSISAIHTPPTPRHGFADAWEPFSPRKSSRIAAAAAAASLQSASRARTPSPAATPRRRPAADAVQRKALFHGSVLSPEATPRKKKMAGSGAATPAGHAAKSAAAAAQAQAARANFGMLPTPAKTPSKKVHAASLNESNIAAIARNLFHTDVDEVMSSPSSARKNGARQPKKYTGLSLESFTVVENEESIPIFTDSQDRVPEADCSAENPFFGTGATLPPPQEPVRRRSKRNIVAIPGEGQQSVEDATRREDGLVYVFRGKKIFRKFADVSAQGQESPRDGSPEPLTPSRRLTRSSIKPRLLFPAAAISTVTSKAAFDAAREDEEADTDIEDHNIETEASSSEVPVVNTPTELVDKTAPNTPPRAPRFAPASPPVTGRATRQKKRSPFDGWRQTKSSAMAPSHKRAGDELGTPIPPATKRTRT